MNRWFKFTLIGAVIVASVFGPVYINVAYAQVRTGTGPILTPSQAQALALATKENPDQPSSGDAKGGQCFSFTGGINWSTCFARIFAQIANTVLWIVSWVVWIAGSILNFVVKYTITDMSKNIDGVTGINKAWRAIRDLANMSFIFILLYTAVSTVLGIGRDWRGTVIKVVVVALLINFSMFFTKVVIDASNVVALGFLDAIGASEGFTRTDIPWDAGLSNAFVRPMGVTGIFDKSAIQDVSGNVGGTGIYQRIIIIGLAGSVFLLIAAFVLFAAAFMLLIRYVVLIFLLILSPLAFIGHILPGVNSYASKWRETLFGQALFAPVFMMLLWLTLVVLNDVNFSGSNYGVGVGSKSMAKIVNDGSATGLIMNFAIVIMFLVATLVISKSFATKGGGAVASIMNKAPGMAGAAVFGSAAYAGRGTVGRMANRLSESETLKRWKASGNFASRNLANLTLGASSRVASQNFDMRGVLSKELGAGKASNKGGYKQVLKDYNKKKEEEAKDLKVNTYDKGRRETIARKHKDEVRERSAELKRQALKLKSIKESDDYKKQKAKVVEETTKKDELTKERVEKEKQLRELDASKSSYTAPDRKEVFERRRETMSKELEELTLREKEQNEIVKTAQKAVADIDNQEAKFIREAQELDASLLKEEKTKNGKTVFLEGQRDASGKFRKDSDGRFYDTQNRRVNEKGFLLNEKGQQIAKMVAKETDDIIKDVDSERIERFAEKTQERSFYNPIGWIPGMKRSNSVKKLKAAEAIRKLNKDKKTEEKLKEIAKELGMTEEGAEEIVGGKGSGAAETSGESPDVTADGEGGGQTV